VLSHEETAAAAEEAILSTLGRYPSGRPPTPRALQEAAGYGRPSDVMSRAFWRLVERGTLVFDGNARVKLNDVSPRA
jgi:hypothetical protein